MQAEPPVQNADAAPPAAAASSAAVLALTGAPSGLVRRTLTAVLSEHSVLLLAATYFLAVWALTPDVATPRNLRNLFLNLLPLLAVAVGQTVVMISGGIDLSATSIIAACSVIAATVMTETSGARTVPLPGMVPWAILAALAAGAAMGSFNGAAVGALGMPPFIATLGSMMVVSGGVLWWTKSKNVAGLPESFVSLLAGEWLGVPSAAWVVATLALAVHLLLSRTLWGYWLYATGHNPRASLVSGVPVRRITAAAYAVSGFCAAVAALLYTARLESGSPVMGREILLDVIGATVIGGTSLFGGKGRLTWTVCGVLLFALIDNSLNLMGLEYYTIWTVKGLVILGAAALDLLRARVLAGA